MEPKRQTRILLKAFIEFVSLRFSTKIQMSVRIFATMRKRATHKHTEHALNHIFTQK